MKIYSWNVNGIRAVLNKGFIEWVQAEQPDILCLQETKASPEQLEEKLEKLPGYDIFWHSGQRKGYSGVATFTRTRPQQVESLTGFAGLDGEGRVLRTDYPQFTMLNVYFPNGQMNHERLQYKLAFYKQMMEYCESLRKNYPNLIICGDFNTAHREIDLKNPKSNAKRSGFLPEERALLDDFLNLGYTDAFRHLYPERVQYSWWDYRTRARERNAGWRIDCFYVSNSMIAWVEDCFIMDQVQGSDHCPVGLQIKR